MRKSIDRALPTGAGVAADPISAAWAALKHHLESRSKELNDEIRDYPTPIARCDEQLSGLIDQRASALNQLKRMHEVTSIDPARADCPSHVAARRFVNSYPQSDDDSEMRSLARLKSALSRLRRNCH